MEQVFVVERAAFFGGRWPSGFEPWSRTDAPRRLAAFEAAGFFVDRELAETEPAWKQLVPYCAVVCGESVFRVERLRAQGERRLHGSWSIGIGGHVNPDDGELAGIVRRALARELAEELVLPGTAAQSARAVGMINDDRDAVGSVHCGMAYVIEVEEDAREFVEVREISKMRGGFERLAECGELWQDLRFESWSRLFLKALLDAKGGTEDRAG